MDGNKKMALLGSAPIPKALLSLGLPTMTGMLINALYNLADAYFVGGLGTVQMGAVTVAFPLGQVVVGLGLLFGNGAAAYLSRLLGRGDRDTANKVASTALYGGVSLGVVVILFSLIFLEPVLQRAGAIESVMPYAAAYARIYITFSIFNVFNVTMNNIVSSEGAAKTAMCALMAGAVLNVALDPVFIYMLDLGVTGAAIATAISQMVSTLFYLCYILRKKSVFHFSIKACRFGKEVMPEILKIGIPTLIFQLLTSLSIAMINGAAKEYGSSALAAMGPVTKIMSMGTLIVFGFLKGFQPVAGFSYGAKKFDRLREAIRTAILWSTIFCVIFWPCHRRVSRADHVSVHKRGCGDDPRRFDRAAGKRPFLHPLWLLYGVFVFVPCDGKGRGGVYPRRLPPGDMLCPRYSDPSGGMGIKRRPLCAAHSGCCFGAYCRSHGGSPAQRIAGSGSAGFDRLREEANTPPPRKPYQLRCQMSSLYCRMVRSEEK